MSNYLVKIIRDEDGEKVDKPEWHYVNSWGDSDRTLCSGEVFGFGEGSAEYRVKTTSKGGITCVKCLQIINEIKNIKL